MNRNGRRANSFLKGAILGGVIGAALGLLGAPQSGEDTQSQIRARAREAGKRAEDTAQHARLRAEQAVEEFRRSVERWRQYIQASIEGQVSRTQAAFKAAKQAYGADEEEIP